MIKNVNRRHHFIQDTGIVQYGVIRTVIISVYICIYIYKYKHLIYFIYESARLARNVVFSPEPGKIRGSRVVEEWL